MARTVRNAKIDTRSARTRLHHRREPHWTVISQGCAVGYRKGAKGGTWVARWRDSRGKQHYHPLGAADDAMDADSIRVLDYSDAQGRAREWFAEMAAGSDRREKPNGPYTVSDACRDYLEAKGQSKSIRQSKHAIDCHIVPKLGDKLLRDLTAGEVRRWHRQIAEAPPRLRTGRFASMPNTRDNSDDPEAARKRKSTANRLLTVLKAVLNFAFSEGKVDSDAEWRRMKAYREADAARVHYLDRAKSKRLVNACETAFRRLVQGALLTGARYGELVRFVVSDYHRDSGTLQVRASKASKPRHIELTEEGVAFFEQITAGRPNDELLFTRRDGSRWGAGYQARPMQIARTRARIEDEISFHVLRHTYASLLVMDGVPLMVVARNLGHSDTRMVEKHYGHLARSYIRDAVRASHPFGITERSNVAPLAAHQEATA